MLGLDTNILLRWLIDESLWPTDNPKQWAAVRRLIDDDERQFYVNLIVLAETLWIVEQRLKQAAPVVAEILTRLEGAANLTLQERDAVRAASASHVRRHPGVVDRLIAEVNKRAGCEATLTFDVSASRTPGFRLLKARD
jgi:predicted nucleic-acid-binding protein